MLTAIRTRNQVFRFCTRQFHHHVVSKQTIKPSLPTNPCLKRYNLSLMDQLHRSQYISFIFHYQNNTDMQDSVVEKSRRLKNSMANALTQHYPFAGRLDSSGSYVSCEDEGIEFQEVSVESRFAEFIKKPEHEVLDFLYPKHEFTYKHDSALLVVRLHHFQCGGVSILVRMSHVLGDGASFITFMKSWAVNSRRISNNSTSNKEMITEAPHFLSHPDGIECGSGQPIAAPKIPMSTKKFVFPNSVLAKLKTEIGELYSSATTRVEALSSLILKRAMATSGDFSPMAFFFPVNMRSRMDPPLPETSIGNLLWIMGAEIRNSKEHNLKVIVEKIKAAKVEFGSMTKWENLERSWAVQENKPSDYKFFVCSSICRMQFYEIDFGWGNPDRVLLADYMLHNGFVLMDTPNGDGTEAIVTLDEHHMNIFQDDQELLAYTCDY